MKGVTSVVVLVLAVSFSLVSAQWLEKVIELPDSMGHLSGPSRVAQNPVSGNMYVAGSQGVLLFDPVTLEKKGLLPGVGEPLFCPEVGKGYLLGDSLMVLDLAGDSIIDAIPYLFSPRWVVYTPTSRKLYMGTGNVGTSMASFDVDGDTFLHVFGQDTWYYPPAWDPVHNRLFLALHSGDEWLGVIDCAEDTFLAHLPLGDVQDIVACGDGEVYCNLGDSMVIVDADSLVVTGRIPGNVPADTLVYCGLTNRVYAPRLDTVTVIDCAVDTVRARIGLPDSHSHGDFACSEASGKAYVLLSSELTLAVIDTLDQVSSYVRRAGDRVFDEVGFANGYADLYVAMDQDTILRVNTDADTVSGLIPYPYFRVSGLLHNPAGNVLYAFCYNKDAIAAIDSDGEVTGYTEGIPFGHDLSMVLNPVLNRLYVAGDYVLGVVDCNTMQVIHTESLPHFEETAMLLLADLGKLYLFPRNFTDSLGHNFRVFDCWSNSIVAEKELPNEVPHAVYHPASDLVYFCCRDTPSVRVLDPATNNIVRTLNVSGTHADDRLAVDLDRNRVYFSSVSNDMLVVIDAPTNTVLDSVDLPRDVDTLVMNHEQDKLYLLRLASSGRFYVYDCAADSLLPEKDFDPNYVALLNVRNDKLYFESDLGLRVVDCRDDSMVGYWPEGRGVRSLAWNAIDNYVYAARRGPEILVIADHPIGVEEMPNAEVRMRNATIVRGMLPMTGRKPAMLLDITGRRVLDLLPGENDVSGLSPGVYFVRRHDEASPVRKVVIQR